MTRTPSRVIGGGLERSQSDHRKGRRVPPGRATDEATGFLTLSGAAETVADPRVDLMAWATELVRDWPPLDAEQARLVRDLLGPGSRCHGGSWREQGATNQR
jgi:hypothetical protein